MTDSIHFQNEEFRKCCARFGKVSANLDIMLHFLKGVAKFRQKVWKTGNFEKLASIFKNSDDFSGRSDAKVRKSCR